jgi:hypothetical protein
MLETRIPGTNSPSHLRHLGAALAILALVGSAGPLRAEDTPAVMRVTNQVAKTLTVKMMPSEGENAQAKLAQGKSNGFSFPPGQDCADQTVDYEIRLINSVVNRLYASGSFDLVAVSDDSGVCTLEVRKPTVNVPDYNHQLIWKKVSPTEGQLTFTYRGGE